MLIQRATRLDGSVVDLRVTDRIVDVAPTLTPRAGEAVLDAAHATVIPGLHDHHVHVHSAAAALGSLRVGPADVGDRTGLAAALYAAVPGEDGWIRAVGYHESVAGPLDRATLDAIGPPVPLRVQDRSGVLWTLNSAGLTLLGRGDHPDGRLRSADTDWSAGLERRDLPLRELSRQLAAYGVTGITDATPDLDTAQLMAAHRRGDVAQRVHALAPGKRILHDDGLDLDDLVGWITERHRDGTPVALHCVTAAQLVVTLAALRITGVAPGDRIEHAAVVPDDCIPDLATVGVTVVTQPNFVAERGDEYRADVPDSEHRELWRVATLLTAGIPLALSTDTPFGDGDPWAAMRAAVHRRTPTGEVLGPEERIAAATALTLFLGTADRPSSPRRLVPGAPGDLCLVAAPPADVLAELDAGLVSSTIVSGDVVWERP